MNGRKIGTLFCVVLVLCLAGLACNASSLIQDATATSIPPSTSEPVLDPAITSSPRFTPDPTPTLKLAEHEELVWFQPMDHYPRPRPDGSDLVGANDFMDLFSPDAPWSQAADRVDVFTFFLQFTQFATNREVEQAVRELNRRGIAIGLETGVLSPSEECGHHVEGFITREANLRFVRRIKRAGGTLRFVTFDNPYAGAEHYSGENACHWEPERIAREAHKTVELIREVFPNVKVGSNDWGGVGYGELKDWFETYRDVTGSYFDFFHLDVNYGDSQWAQKAKDLEGYAQERGIHFGVIYIGNFRMSSDRAWVDLVEQRIHHYEMVHGGNPDHVVIDSWQDRPNHLLPETDPSAFTHLINRYFRPRTHLTLNGEILPDTDDLTLTGRLRKEDGTIIPDAPITAAIRPEQGLGYMDQFSLSGEVPDEAAYATIGFRLNMECPSCRSGAGSEVVLNEVSYREGAGGENLVPNGDFRSGLFGWGSSGSASARIVEQDDGGGVSLDVKAISNQHSLLNSKQFEVTPGHKYEAEFTARISHQSQPAGYFTLMFLDQDRREFHREKIYFQSSTLRREGTTNADGMYEILIPRGRLSSGLHKVDVNYPGELQSTVLGSGAWPAAASGLVDVP